MRMGSRWSKADEIAKSVSLAHRIKSWNSAYKDRYEALHLGITCNGTAEHVLHNTQEHELKDAVQSTDPIATERGK